MKKEAVASLEDCKTQYEIQAVECERKLREQVSLLEGEVHKIQSEYSREQERIKSLELTEK